MQTPRARYWDALHRQGSPADDLPYGSARRLYAAISTALLPAIANADRPMWIHVVTPIGMGTTMAIRRVALAARGPHHRLAEATAIHRMAKLLRDESTPFEERTRVGDPAPMWHPSVPAIPLRAPHHTISTAGVAGSNTHPGEIHLAHGGILYLDEANEFTRQARETVAKALNASRDGLSLPIPANPHPKGRGAFTLPACFHLVTHVFTCHCGYHGDKRGTPRKCTCSAAVKGKPSADTLEQFKAQGLSPDITIEEMGHPDDWPLKTLETL